MRENQNYFEMPLNSFLEFFSFLNNIIIYIIIIKYIIKYMGSADPTN